MAYEPESPPEVIDNWQLLRDYMYSELKRIAQEVNSGGGVIGAGLTPLHKEPKKPRDFQIVAADGVDWNPGHGTGVYVWMAQAWVPMFQLQDEPPGEPPDEPVEPPVEPPVSEGGYDFLSSWENGHKAGAVFNDGSVQPNFWRTGQTRDVNDRLQIIDKSSLPGGVVADGSKALSQYCLNTDFISSNNWVRSELDLSAAATGGQEGNEHWWAMSILIPDDYVFPPDTWEAAVHAQYHTTRSGGTKPLWALHVANEPQAGVDKIMWRLFLSDGNTEYGPRVYPRGRYVAIPRNTWFDMTWNIKYSADPAVGHFKFWMRERSESQQARALAPQWDPVRTLDPGYQSYFKFGTYHAPYGSPHAGRIIHDRVLRGPTAGSVAMCSLEGVVI